jgi:undecaprenyl-diphosphatase
MPLYQAIVLGIVQGLTEFLPISSTAHLYLVPWLSGWEEHSLTFDVALHVGTLFAVLCYFFRTWVDLLLAGFGVRTTPALGLGLQPRHAPHRLLFWLLVIGTFPGALAGLLLEAHIETTFRNPFVMGAALIVVALVMAWGERVGGYQKDLAHLSRADAVWVGCAQALALVPGVSRSGITMTAGLLRDFRRDAAARFSFLLSTPIIGGASLKAAIDLYREGIPPEMAMPFVVGTLASAISGYLTISFFLRFLQFGTFRIFVYYRLVLGIIVIALALMSAS